jgi:hypothetical protein
MNALLNDPVSLDQANYEDHQGNDQQNVNQPTGGVRSDYSQDPQNEQNRE